MNQEIAHIINQVGKNQKRFTPQSQDTQQIDPLLRIASLTTILATIKIPEQSTILDIGTGYGYGAVLLHALGHNVIAMERNKKKLEEGKAYWKTLDIDVEETDDLSHALSTNKKLYFMQKCATKLEDFPFQSIDAVTSFYISGYMLGKKGAFNDVHKIMKNTGKLIITTQGHDAIPQQLRSMSVCVGSRMFTPQGLVRSSLTILDAAKAYDRFVIEYKKD